MGNSCCQEPLVLIQEPRRSNSSRKCSILFEHFSKQTDYKLKYELIELLGNGGFGKVRLYREKKCPEMKYAIKTLKKDFFNKHRIQSMTREVEILRKLDHPNIVKYFETYEDEQYLHIVMEYIPGENLLKLLSRKRYMEFGEYDICKIASVLFKSVQFLHNNKIIHRDLKPENILFSINGSYDTLKLIDFGLSIGNREEDNYRVGSPYYMAPEMIDGNFSYETDIWSIGVILYFMTCGKQPFFGEHRSEIYNKIRKGKFDMGPLNKANCSKELKNLIKKMLVVDPKKRITISSCLNHPWFETVLTAEETVPLGREILDSIKEFNNKNLLQKEILFMMARVSKENELIKLKQAFTIIDKNHSGEIEMKEIPLIFEKLGLKPTQTDISDIWNSLDFHKDGKINYTEFLAATLSSINFYKEEKLWSVFQFFDPGDTGLITADSVIDALNACNLKVNETELIQLFKNLSKADSQLTFEDFKSIFFGGQPSIFRSNNNIGTFNSNNVHNSVKNLNNSSSARYNTNMSNTLNNNDFDSIRIINKKDYV